MRAVGLRMFKDRLSEYVRLANSGETVLITDRERVVAELVPPREGRADSVQDAMLADAIRNGWLTPALGPSVASIPRRPAVRLETLLDELADDRGERSIYVDSSVVLAQLLAEDRYPAEIVLGRWACWCPVVSWSTRSGTRINARGLGSSHAEDVRTIMARLGFLELAPAVLARAIEPYPVPVRTLDALHLASVEFLRALGQRPSIATYDRRMIEAAKAMEHPRRRSVTGNPTGDGSGGATRA